LSLTYNYNRFGSLQRSSMLADIIYFVKFFITLVVCVCLLGGHYWMHPPSSPLREAALQYKVFIGALQATQI
jgi:hypothetical protein